MSKTTRGSRAPHGYAPTAPVEDADPLVKTLFLQMKAEGVSLSELERKSGVPKTVIRNWFRARRAIYLPSLRACLAVFRIDLKPVPMDYAALAVKEPALGKPAPKVRTRTRKSTQPIGTPL